MVTSYPANDLVACNIYIFAVICAIDRFKQPYFHPLVQAGELIGSVIKNDDIIIYESTANLCVNEELCISVTGQVSGLKFNVDFFVCYSPECINLGKQGCRLENIIKITDGSTKVPADFIFDTFIETLSQVSHVHH